ncbi:uncharacterized protein [Ptychodera flava]|uniref:uncharacterized protein n=1 Tax=Ptychodera flava TaxID=63121 RepID=UPI00396A68A7
MAIRNRGPGTANEQEDETTHSSSSTMVKSSWSDAPKDFKRHDSVTVPDDIVRSMESLSKKDTRRFARALNILNEPDIEDIFDDHGRYEVQATQETGYDCSKEGLEKGNHQDKRQVFRKRNEEDESSRSLSSRIRTTDQEERQGNMINKTMILTALAIIFPFLTVVMFNWAPWSTCSSYWYLVFAGINACASIAVLKSVPKIRRWLSPTPHIDLRRPSRSFTGSGHDEILRQINLNYRSNKRENDVFVEVLYGLGGCGKTEIACSYVWKNWRRYDSVIVLNGKSNSFLDFGFKKMLENMNMDLSDAEKGPSSIRLAALNKLSSMKDWLLVIDDVDDPRFIKQALPKSAHLQNGHILITSRVGAEWDDWYETINTFVRPFSPEDSALFLIRHEKKKPLTLQEARNTLEKLKSSNREEYDALMWLGGEEGLHGLPLALKQARNYISKNNVTFKKYKQMYEKCKLGMLECDHDRGSLEAWIEYHKIDTELESTLQTCIEKHAHGMKDLSEEKLQDEFKMTEYQASVVKRAIDGTKAQEFVEFADESSMNVITTWQINYKKTVKDKHTKEYAYNIALHQLGRFYQDSKAYDRAHGYLKKSLEMRKRYLKRKFGTYKVGSVACSMTNLARNYILSSSNEVADTERLLNKAMKIKRNLMAETNEYFQLGVYYLAVFYRQQKSDRESEFAKEIILEEYKRLYEAEVELTDLHTAFQPEKMII